MSVSNTVQPRLPLPPVDYNQQYMDQLLNVLRQYFAQIENPGPVNAATQRVSAVGSTPAQIFAGLSFAQASAANPAVTFASVPTQDDLLNLRIGDVYVDTTADNVLKVKMS